ncbi:putative monooxygenase [Actinacidiphila reveromycinica]|uniref:Putative monooxygenase n=1 Tax=Actinacidiphila reveromycinica TaxID=659352 RepID=A0A7U3VS45_9ACTN|nr:antibiotic biosynthesis monooxygenase family protein [Streptomyces sp. SN-593]BBB01455.1 putative monooxygenase [Streptomyces sp. SN-593]
MPFLSPDDGYLTVLNLFRTETRQGQDRLLDVMRDIIDNADYPGWISSTLHSGQDAHGTANYIQWRSLEDLKARYAGEGFQHHTVPLFNELATSIRLLQTEVVASRLHPDLERVEVSAEDDAYTVIVVFDVDPVDQKDLVDTLAQPEEWVLTHRGHRSHTILRGLDGETVVNYAQWDSKEAYDAFHRLPEENRPASVRRGREHVRSLVTARDANTYTVVHSRSATG